MIPVDAVQHTHHEGNVGLRGDAACPACRASGRTLEPEQTHVVADLLARLAGPLSEVDPAFGLYDEVRVTLIEAVLRSAEQQRIVDRRRVEVAAERYEQEARNDTRSAAALYEDDPRDTLGTAGRLLAEGHRCADRATALRSVRL